MKIRCAYDKLVPISSLTPHPRNRNKHPQAQIKALAKIISSSGWRKPIVVSKRSGFITAGHGRLEVARYMDLKKVPVNFQDYDDENQEYADLTADNAIALWADLDLSGVNADIGDLGPDFDVGLLGIEGFTVDVAEKQKGGELEDFIPPPPKKAKSKPGELYQLGGGHMLLCGDSTSSSDVGRLLGKETVELCFTSPPYADQREYNGGKDLSTEHLATFIRAARAHVKYFAVNLGYSRKQGEVFPYWDDYINEAKGCGLQFLSWNIWDRGSAFSIGQQTAMFPIEHEWVFVFGAAGKKLNCTIPNKHAGGKTGATNRQHDGSLKRKDPYQIKEFRPLGTLCRIGVDRDHSIDHPAKFPVSFAEAYILAMTQPQEIVYEPFGGSGTVLIAAQKHNRKARLMEIDPVYCDLILTRFKNFTGEDPCRIEPDGSTTPWSKIAGRK